jgi:hypothetical protein
MPSDSIERALGNVSGFTNNTPINSKLTLDKNTARGSQEITAQQMDYQALAALKKELYTTGANHRRSMDRFFSQDNSPTTRKESINESMEIEQNIKILQDNTP